MKLRRHVRMFQPRFVPGILAGTKTSTIRPIPKREIHVGDLLDLRTWCGKPYRSKQRKLREFICTRIRCIEMDSTGGLTWILKRPDYLRAAEEVALGEGFIDRGDMIQWFKQTHGFPFKGVLIEWQP